MSILPPLPERMRPKTLDEYVGQKHLVGPNAVLRRMIESGMVSSFILWGPPGVGKTTLAKIIANSTKSPFYTLSAVTSGVKDVRDVIDRCKNDALGVFSTGRPILFIDEIHRFSKSQQDSLLGAVESGIITLIGATTENPSFEVIRPLLSRARVYTLQPLDSTDLQVLLDRAITTDEVLSKRDIKVEETTALFRFSGGDARKLLNILDLLEQSVAYGKPLVINAIYWLARMINGGEDPEFIARRLAILASEDIGLANPNAMLLANTTYEIIQKIGMPEGRIPLAECTIYLATSPKSNSAYMAINSALELVKQTGDLPVPLHIRNAPTKLMKDIGYGVDYKYAHDYPGHFVKQQFLPDDLVGTRLWNAADNPAEQKADALQKQRWGDSKH